MIAAGYDGNDMDSVIEYDIDSNIYKNVLSLPKAFRNPKLVKINDGYIYSFGGIENYDIFRISLSFTTEWEKVGTTTNENHLSLVIPYSF